MRHFIILLVSLAVNTSAFGQSAAEQMRKAQALMASGDQDQAQALLLKIIEQYPRYGPARLQLGRTYVESAEWERAEVHLLAATRSNLPRRFLAWHFLGRVHLAKGDYQKAGDSFREAIALAPEFAPARLFLIEVAKQSENQWEVLAAYREALEAAPSIPERPELEARMANVARSMGAHELAECAVQQAIDAKPDDGAFYHLLAVILQDAGRAEEALTACEKAIALGFHAAPVYVTLGDLYHDKMLLSESIDALGKAIELDPEAAESIASFALLTLTTEDYEALRELLEKHVQTHPDNVNTLYSLALMRLRKGGLDEAEKLFLHVGELVPRRAQVHYNLAMIYSRQGREENADLAMDRFRELKGLENEEWERQNAIRARRSAAREAASPDQAIEIYSALAKEGVAAVDDLIALGKLSLETERNDEAWIWFREALEREPYNKQGLEGLAQAAKALEQSDLLLQCQKHLELLENPCHK